jgi:S-DNA-T family DNA segregation ATPase FtsK/SpoIIIE
LTRLRAHTAQHWQTSLAADRADWPAVTAGRGLWQPAREMLYLEAKRDGVHGLIAGGTGSGKSELLMTLIVGLALEYDPSVLNFVLVDFKGGGAFRALPRTCRTVVDIVTNLNAAGRAAHVHRHQCRAAAAAKLKRRHAKQRILSNIAPRAFTCAGRRAIPYPHLFIIIDEYAEMIADNPEFKDELDSITRVGRAQGVNLLLAAQRPSASPTRCGPTSSIRICLRVEETDTSREMLRRSDAAFLPNGMPGRGYLQIGNENIELMQVAWTGED